MRRRIGPALAGGANRPVVLGEYPYYRAHPDRWGANLRELRRLGVDVVSCYLPWRFHEVTDGPQRAFDFTGRTDPQRDVHRLLDLAEAEGLTAVLKPGPFIHAEVQLGGLPDRLCGVDRVPYTGLNGRPQTSQGRPLPSPLDPLTREEMTIWLRAVADQVVSPRARPRGPVVAVQLGNEGILGDAHLPITGQDASLAARGAFAAWLGARTGERRSGEIAQDLAAWSGSLRAAWSRWSGQPIVDTWAWMADLFPRDLPTLVNIPFAPATGPSLAIDAWAARHRAFRTASHLRGHTEWIGNAADDPMALSAHIVQSRLGEPDTVEANWGFTWDDLGFAEPRVPLFHALLALILGSTTVSVYTACSTGTWGPEIEMDPVGLSLEGVDPDLHAPPYCPGAPLTERGDPGPTAEALGAITDFLRETGSELMGSHLVRDGTLIVDPAVPERRAWAPEGSVPAMTQVILAVGEVLRTRGVFLDPQWLDDPSAQATGPAGEGEIRAVLRAVLRAGPARIGPGTRQRGNELLVDPYHTPPGVITEYLASLVPGSLVPEWRAITGRVAVLRRWNEAEGVEFVGMFNPGEHDGRVGRTTGAARIEVTVPAGAATILALRGGRLYCQAATSGRAGRQVSITTD